MVRILKYPNTVFYLITAHAPISKQSSNSAVFRLQPVYFCLFLFNGICCGYPFELHRLVDAIQMNTTTYAFIRNSDSEKKTKKTSHKHHWVSPSLICFFFFFCFFFSLICFILFVYFCFVLFVCCCFFFFFFFFFLKCTLTIGRYILYHKFT